MAKGKESQEIDTSTEDKIIEASRRVFTKKGYMGTRTRDVAEEAGINPALLNYYFRSKEKLFQLVMEEKLQQFFSAVFSVADNEELALDEKLHILVENYINLLVASPDMPIFLLSEVQSNPERFKTEMQVQKILNSTSFVRQIREKRPDLDPLQFVASILGMIVFPFVARAVLFPEEKRFKALMEERKKLVAVWSKAILDA